MIGPLALALAACASGCLDPSLGADPFSCARGACPSGYRCVRSGPEGAPLALCIANGDPDPPKLAATTSDRAADPVLAWDGAELALFWQRSTGAGDGKDGLTFSELATDPPAEHLLLPDPGDTVSWSFDVLYHPSLGQYLGAVAVNGLKSATVGLYAVPTDGSGSPTPVLPVATPVDCTGAKGMQVDCSRFGVTRPSLALGPGDTVEAAYTFGGPPFIPPVAVQCLEVDLGSGGATSCAPTAAQLGAAFPTSAVVATSDQRRALLWGDTALHVVSWSRQGAGWGPPSPPQPLQSALAVGRIAAVADHYAITLQLSSGDGPPRWSALLGVLGGAQPMQVATAPAGSPFQPDVALADPATFATCSLDAAGELEVGSYAVSDMGRLATTAVPRLSRAGIDQCRLAAVPEQHAVAVAWRERVPPATARIFYAFVPLP